MGHPIYHLDISVMTCKVEARLNGFPVFSLEDVSGAPQAFAPPLNPFLAGARNELEVELQAATRKDGSLTTFDDARVSGTIRAFEKGDAVAPGAGEVVLRFGITDELRKRVEEDELQLPIVLHETFATPQVDHAAELRDASPIADVEALRDYGVRLRDLALAGDVGGLLGAFEGKIQAWVRAYQEPYAAFADSMRDEIGSFLAAGPDLEFGREDIVPRPLCGGRIWELTRGDARPLLATPEVGPDKTSEFFRIYVGAHAGALGIVR
jgi:hypothetical protein